MDQFDMPVERFGRDLKQSNGFASAVPSFPGLGMSAPPLSPLYSNLSIGDLGSDFEMEPPGDGRVSPRARRDLVPRRVGARRRLRTSSTTSSLSPTSESPNRLQIPSPVESARVRKTPATTSFKTASVECIYCGFLDYNLRHIGSFDDSCYGKCCGGLFIPDETGGTLHCIYCNVTLTKVVFICPLCKQRSRCCLDGRDKLARGLARVDKVSVYRTLVFVTDKA